MVHARAEAPTNRAQRGAFSALRRYGLATAGPVSSAVAQFVLTIQALHLMTPEAFGAFAFLLIGQQFALGVWNAMFCAPIAVVLNGTRDERNRNRLLRSIFVTSLACATLAALLLAAIAAALGVAAAAIFGAFTGVSLLRWLARAYAYAVGVPLRTMASDLLYSVILLAGGIGIGLFGADAPTAFYALLLIGAACGLLPFGRLCLSQQFLGLSPRHLRAYPEIWRPYAKWSLTGVITTEITANAHAYLVAAFAGPAAFAPIVASALVARPITVAMNALSEFERPAMARRIGGSDLTGTIQLARGCRLALVAGWLATALVAGPLVLFMPHVLFSAQYDPSLVVLGAALWMIVSMVRLLRIPESTMLQAAGLFRALAIPSTVSCGASVAAVLLLLAFAPPVWTIVGILIGEIVFAIGILLQARSWLRTATHRTTSRPPIAREVGLCG